MNYFWRRYAASGFIFLCLFGALYLINHPDFIKKIIGKLSGNDVVKNEASFVGFDADVPYSKNLIPVCDAGDEWIIKPNYAILYDEAVVQARVSIHKLSKKDTQGSAVRYGLRFDEDEPVMSEIASWKDYSGTGFDRGHLVPSGDFQCCQDLLTATFAMSNVAPFDSVLNRHAWQELEIFTRRMARKKGEIYVLTGPIFKKPERFIGRFHDIQIPSHFFKVLVYQPDSQASPQAVAAYVLPNIPLMEFDEKAFRVSIDNLEHQTGVDFFAYLPDHIEAQFENKVKFGSW